MQNFWYADAHSCLPLHGDTDLNQLRLHYDAGVRYLSVNVGMDMNPLPSPDTAAKSRRVTGSNLPKAPPTSHASPAKTAWR